MSISRSRSNTIKRFTASLAFAVACSPLFANAAEGDGAALFAAKACTACHGAQGRKSTNGDIPNIAGQNRDYLVMQIKLIRDGDRDSGNAIQMRGIAQTLTDDDIELIADYLSSQVVTYAE